MLNNASRYKILSKRIKILSGIPEEKASKGNDFAKELEVAVDGNKYVLKSEAGQTTLTLNEEYEDKLPGGQVLKVIFK